MGESEEEIEDDAVVLDITTGWVVEIFTELWMLNYGKLEEDQVYGEEGSMHSVWVE